MNCRQPFRDMSLNFVMLHEPWIKRVLLEYPTDFIGTFTSGLRRHSSTTRIHCWGGNGPSIYDNARNVLAILSRCWTYAKSTRTTRATATGAKRTTRTTRHAATRTNTQERGAYGWCLSSRIWSLWWSLVLRQRNKVIDSRCQMTENLR